MTIKAIGSGSYGNCYRIDDGHTALLLEAGLPIKKIKAGCDYDLASIAGCLVTHEHKDHSLAVNDLMKSGVDLYMTEGTANACGVETYRLHLFLKSGKYYLRQEIGSFSIIPFPVHHDAAEPVGYLIRSLVTGEKLLFVTDTYYIDYRFEGLTHIMVEANYSADALADAENDSRRYRLRKSHMSLETCIKLLEANDLSNVKEIWLIHLSTGNGNAVEFKRRVQEATGRVVYVA